MAGRLIDGNDSPVAFTRVGTDAEIRNVVREQAAQGVDFIKLYVGLTPDLVRAGIEEAHAHGLRVIGHLGRTTWAEAAELGIDALTHSWFAGMSHSIVPKQHRAEFQDFYMPNSRFDPGLFHKWRQVVNPRGPELARLASLLRERHVSVDPLAAIANTRKIEQVWLGGRSFEPAHLLAGH